MIDTSEANRLLRTTAEHIVIDDESLSLVAGGQQARQMLPLALIETVDLAVSGDDSLNADQQTGETQNPNDLRRRLDDIGSYLAISVAVSSVAAYLLTSSRQAGTLGAGAEDESLGVTRKFEVTHTVEEATERLITLDALRERMVEFVSANPECTFDGIVKHLSDGNDEVMVRIIALSRGSLTDDPRIYVNGSGEDIRRYSIKPASIDRVERYRNSLPRIRRFLASNPGQQYTAKHLYMHVFGRRPSPDDGILFGLMLNSSDGIAMTYGQIKRKSTSTSTYPKIDRFYNLADDKFLGIDEMSA